MKQINAFKKAALSIAALLVVSFSAQAQLNGTYTIGGTSPDYSTLKAAITALNSNGVNGSVTFLIRSGTYSGSNWMGSINNVAGASSANRITFRSQSGNKGDVVLKNNSSSNYTFRFNNAKFITVRDMTLEKTSSSRCRVFDFAGTAASNDSVINCIIKAPVIKSSSNARALVYGYGHTGSDNVFYNNEFINGGQWVYVRGSNTSSNPTNMIFANNKFTANNSGYYGIYSYYSSGLKFLNNEFSRTGSGTYYFGYIYYANNDFEFSDNTVNVSTTSTLYGLRFYYMNYTTNSATMTPKVHDNNITFGNSSGTTYPFYTYYAHHATYLNNTVNCTQTSGYIRAYGPLYYNRDSRAENNVLNYTTTGTGRIYTQYMCYNGANWPDTFTNNVVNCDGYYVYNYLSYYGNTRITNNEYNVDAVSTTYNYMYYSNGVYFADNTVKATTNGTLYGLYEYGSSSYSGGTCINNTFEFESDNNTVYGLYPYYSKMKYKGNLVTTKTSGSNYTVYPRYNYSSEFVNNTFHSNATGNTNYVAYVYNTSSSYNSEFRNNIFSKSGTKGYGMWIYNKNYFDADYNLYSMNGGTTFYSRSPSYQGDDLTEWRNKTGTDKNSLVYEAPYVDAAGGDFHIDPTSPAAWAVNGRAEHDTTLVTDLSGTVRPKFVQDGVPDLGAYEVSPTSTPPNAVATPTDPVANSTQIFTFGQDVVATIDWGATVPNTYTMRQYTGVQAMPMPAGVGRMYFYVAGTPSSWMHEHTPNIHYKDPWIGDIPTEADAVIARSSNSGAWEGYNYTNAATDITNNILSPAAPLDSIGSYTGVQNGRIGIRCVEEPNGIAITNITANEADIEWQPVFNPIGYQVVLKTKLEAPTTTEWDNASFPTTNSLAASGLTEDIKYYVYIRSVCGIKDTSGYSLDSFITLITCHDPEITVSDITDSRAVISWQNVKTAVKYEYTMTTSPNTPGFGTDLNKTSVLAPFLDPGTMYYVHVRAHCSDIYPNSNWSMASFRTEWPTGINDKTTANGLSVYPNPASDEMVVFVKGIAGKDGTINVTDMTGKVLLSRVSTGSKTNVDVSSLPAGMYIVQYANADNRAQMKFSKQ